MNDVLVPLFEMARQGCEVSCNTILALTRPELFKVACTRVGESAAADDIVQETQLVAFCKNFDTSGSPPWPWLLRILINRSIMHFRQKGNTIPHNRAVSLFQTSASGEDTCIDPVDSDLAPDQKAIRKENIRQVRECIDQLSQEKREALLLIEFEELTNGEAAEKLGIPSATFISRLREARLKLTEKLQRSDI